MIDTGFTVCHVGLLTHVHNRLRPDANSLPPTGVGATEVFSTRVRAKAMSVAVSTNRLISGLIASSTLPLMETVGPTYVVLDQDQTHRATIFH